MPRFIYVLIFWGGREITFNHVFRASPKELVGVGVLAPWRRLWLGQGFAPMDAPWLELVTLLVVAKQ